MHCGAVDVTLLGPTLIICLFIALVHNHVPVCVFSAQWILHRFKWIQTWTHLRNCIIFLCIFKTHACTFYTSTCVMLSSDQPLSDQWPKTDEVAYWLFAREMDGHHPSGTFGVTVAIRWDSGRGPVLWLMNNHSVGNHEYVNECAHT